jgi:hypothetical protein
LGSLSGVGFYLEWLAAAAVLADDIGTTGSG